MRFTLDDNHRVKLQKIANSGKTAVDVSRRAKILLMKDAGMSAQTIATELGIIRHSVELWVDNVRNRSDEDTIESLLNVSPGRGRKEEIAGEAKARLISVACTQPKDLGYAAETWSVRSLAKYIHEKAKEAGFERLATISTSRLYDSNAKR